MNGVQKMDVQNKISNDISLIESQIENCKQFKFTTSSRFQNSKTSDIIKQINNKKVDINNLLINNDEYTNTNYNQKKSSVALRLVYNLAQSNIENLTPDLVKSLFYVSNDTTYRKYLSGYLLEFVKNGFPVMDDKNLKIKKGKFDGSLDTYIEQMPYDKSQVENLIDYLITNKIPFTYYNLLNLYSKPLSKSEKSEERIELICSSLLKLNDLGNQLSYQIYATSLFGVGITNALSMIPSFMSGNIDTLKVFDIIYNNFAVKSLTTDKNYDKSNHKIFILNIIKNLSQKFGFNSLLEFSSSMLSDIQNNNKDIESILNSIKTQKQSVEEYIQSVNAQNLIKNNNQANDVTQINFNKKHKQSQNENTSRPLSLNRAKEENKNPQNQINFETETVNDQIGEEKDITNNKMVSSQIMNIKLELDVHNESIKNNSTEHNTYNEHEKDNNSKQPDSDNKPEERTDKKGKNQIEAKNNEVEVINNQLDNRNLLISSLLTIETTSEKSKFSWQRKLYTALSITGTVISGVLIFTAALTGIGGIIALAGAVALTAVSLIPTIYNIKKWSDESKKNQLQIVKQSPILDGKNSNEKNNTINQNEVSVKKLVENANDKTIKQKSYTPKELELSSTISYTKEK